MGIGENTYVGWGGARQITPQSQVILSTRPKIKFGVPEGCSGKVFPCLSR
jgi:hypothetical protein